MRYMEILLTQFRVETIRSNYEGVMTLALEIIKGEDEPNKKLLESLEWIKDHTTPRLNTNYFIVVHLIARNLPKSLDALIEVQTERMKTIEFSLGDLISQMKEAHIKINEIVREIAKKYSIDIPYGRTGSAIEVPVLPGIPQNPQSEK